MDSKYELNRLAMSLFAAMHQLQQAEYWLQAMPASKELWLDDDGQRSTYTEIREMVELATSAVYKAQQRAKEINA